MNIRNHYPSGDLDRLLNESNVLYYLALENIAERDLVKMPAHLLMHIFHYAKLHRIHDIERMATLLHNNKKALEALGDALYSAGRYLEAANYYGKSNSESGALIKKARSFVLAGEAQKALEVLSSVHDKSGLSFQEVFLDCLKVADPLSQRIPSLDRHVLRLKVENALDNEIMDQIGHSTTQPIVHGERPWRGQSHTLTEKSVDFA
jgi:tetratricopeptide (TPR) repeat protein